ncbi:MAG: chemotaxis protein CheD [Bdellovibrionaceae bacterium]|nr:chemotaxis protein CheD [Pseudobdellovibrionaceae bacterium]
MNSKEINVHIGEVKIGKQNDMLHSILGSCVGIAFLYPEKKIYGLAHCLLSKSPEKQHSMGAKYVDQAVQSLLILMHLRPEDYPKIDAILAGGGNMTMPEDTDPEKLVGYHNAKTALEELEKKKIKIVRQDLGGMIGRRISIDCETGEYQIKKIPRNIES